MLCPAKLMICLQSKQMANTPGLAYLHVELTSVSDFVEIDLN